jgi:phosphoribosylformylglycinamidine (FGAM) synthase-like amidotransferase family enzyme
MTSAPARSSPSSWRRPSGRSSAASATGGGLILGVCNGFQVLVKAGLIPGDGLPATLTYNNSGRYEARWTRMAPLAGPGPWLTELEKLGRPIELPVAHGEGKFLTKTDAELDGLFARGQIALQYVDDAGEPTESFPANPNGSPRGIAAARDRTGRVFGLMPHPERFVVAAHHPRWTNRDGSGEPDGLLLFRGAIAGIA